MTRRAWSAALEPDLGVIVAYGGLVREPLLSTPRHGWINLHFSLLPAWRGAAPVQHALIAGDARTGASVFRLVPELDAGDVYGMRSTEIAPDATAGVLLDELAVDGADLLAEVVDMIAAGTATATPQEGAPTFAPKLGIDDARLDWTAPADAVRDRFRGVTPEPGAWTTLDGQRLKVLELAAATGSDPAAPGGPPARRQAPARRHRHGAARGGARAAGGAHGDVRGRLVARSRARRHGGAMSGPSTGRAGGGRRDGRGRGPGDRSGT